MHVSAKGLTLLLLGATGLVAGQKAQASDPYRYIPVMEQRAAILDCRRDLGMRGPVRFGGEWPELPLGGQAHVWIVPGPNLSVSQADQINICADEALGRVPSPRLAAETETAEFGACPSHAPVIFGGATYCIRNQ